MIRFFKHDKSVVMPKYSIVWHSSKRWRGLTVIIGYFELRIGDEPKRN